MQPDEIILAVDEANNGTLVNFKLTCFDNSTIDRTTYVGENHTIDSRDQLTLYRTPQKKNGNFKGVAKTTTKFTKDISVLGVDGLAQLTAPIIVEVSFSIPVGATPAQVLETRQRVIALMDRDDIMDNLNLKLMI